MYRSLAIVLTGAAFVAVTLMSNVAVAHHNAYHNLGKCGSAVVCPGPKQKQGTKTKRSNR
jgi:hypothetical protein